MWILNFLPEFFFHLIFIAGILGVIAGFVLGFLPFISKYKFPVQIISLLLLTLGVYMEGGISEKHKWELRVKEMEAKVAEAKAQSEHVNTQIVEKLVTKTQTIKVKGDSIIQYIDREIKVLDTTCVIPESVIKAHNYAALNIAPPEAAP